VVGNNGDRVSGTLAPRPGDSPVAFTQVTNDDGDTIKGTYALAAVPALAVCFGFALDRLAQRRTLGIVLGVVLAVSALASLPFLVW